jgi:hypothetical protein
MVWERLKYERPTKEEARRLFGRASFYADHGLDESIVLVLRHFGFEVETAREVGAERQPDPYHYKRAFKTKRVFLTVDKGFLDNAVYPLSQTRGVVVFNIDTADTKQCSRAIEVVRTILGDLAPVLDESKVVVNADYTLTLTKRTATDEGYTEERTRYKLDDNGTDVWMWSDEKSY